MTSKGRGMQEWLRAFVDSHPGGWDHNAWHGLLTDLSASGHDTADTEAIGRELERERVRAVLEGAGVKGLGPKRRDALVEHFGSLWALRHASADEIAALPHIRRDLAEAILQAIR
jgi:hypothetical protein